MFTKTYKLEIKSVREDGSFEGYASVFGNTDTDGEVVDKGAFKRTLDHSKGVVPILWQHQSDQPIGWNATAEEDNYGLAVSGKLDIERNDVARKAYGFLKMGIEMGGKPGLSIGFVVPRDGAYVKDGVRHFKQVVWKEYSVVTFPANPEATVVSAKAEEILLPRMTPDQISKALRGEDVGLSEDQKKGLDAIKPAAPAATRKGAAVPDTTTTDEQVKDDGAGGDEGAEPMSYGDAMASHQARETLSDHRYAIERAKDQSIDSIKGCMKSKAEKKMLIHKALHSYADDMADWHGKAMDLEDQYGKAEGEQAQIKGMSTGDHMKAQRLLGKAQAHMDEHQAYAAAANEHAKKATNIVSKVGKMYERNDINVADPVGRGPTPKKSETDPVGHPKEEDFGPLSDFFTQFLANHA